MYWRVERWSGGSYVKGVVAVEGGIPLVMDGKIVARLASAAPQARRTRSAPNRSGHGEIRPTDGLHGEKTAYLSLGPISEQKQICVWRLVSCRMRVWRLRECRPSTRPSQWICGSSHGSELRLCRRKHISTRHAVRALREIETKMGRRSWWPRDRG